MLPLMTPSDIFCSLLGDRRFAAPSCASQVRWMPVMTPATFVARAMIAG